MIESEVLCLMNDLLDRCELVLDIKTSETTSTNSSELVMTSHYNLIHDVSCDVSSSGLIIEESFSKLSQKQKLNSNSNSLIVEQVAEDTQSSDIPVNFVEIIQDESNEIESISYSPCEEPLFSDSESECSEIITEEINNKSENLKLSAHKQSLDSGNFPSLSNKLMIDKNDSQISNFKEVSSESDLLNTSVHVHEKAEISDVQEVKGKKLEIYKNYGNGYNHSLPDDAMKIILPDVQNAIKLCTGNSTNKNIDLLGQVKNEYSVKALAEKTDCCDITSEIQSGSQHGEQGCINLQSELSNINGMDSYEFVENAELNIDNPDDTFIESSNFDEVVSKTFSVKTIVDGYLDDVPCEVSSEQIVSNVPNSNYLTLLDISTKNTEEISENVMVIDKQEMEAMNDVKIPLSSFLESTNSTDLKRIKEKLEDNKEPLIKYEIDTSAGNLEQLLIDSQNADFNRGCKRIEIDIETKAFCNDHKTKAGSRIEEENKSDFEPMGSFEQLNNQNGTMHIKPLDCQEIDFADQNLKLSLNEVQTTLNNKSFIKETEVNEKFRRGKISSKRSSCEKNKCAWNNADWKINDTLAEKESCTIKVNGCSDIHRSKSEMKLNSIEMFHKNVDIFHDNDSSILENPLFDGQNTGKEELSTLMHDSNLHDILLESPLKDLSDNGPDNDSKFMNTNSDINAQNSQEYISCAKSAFQDMSQSAIASSLKELTSDGQDQENNSKEIFSELFKSPLHHISQVAEEDTVVKSDVYRSEVVTPDAYIDLDEDLEDILMYPATQCFKPSIRTSDVIGDRAETIEAYQSDNMKEFDFDDVKVPDIIHKRNISNLYSRNQDTSVIKKSRKENDLPCFKWNQTVPVSADITGEEVISMKSLVTCPRPLRLGLSKKQKTKTLHKN